ncbi:MAG: hypothetical protein ILA15_11660 [Clostridiales bacterium]|nr:hypothetical protein [Clostridiales bacterium]
MDAWSTQLGVDTMRAICRIARELENTNEKPHKVSVTDESRVIENCLAEANTDTSSEVMSELLMDPDTTTYKMFEGLAEDYLQGNDDVRKGIDSAVTSLTGWSMASVAWMIINRSSDRDKECK